jgi:hypothetical protein
VIANKTQDTSSVVAEQSISSTSMASDKSQAQSRDFQQPADALGSFLQVNAIL